MSKITVIFFLLIIVSSCAPPLYNYQLFVSESPDMVEKNNVLIFEDSNCTISYDLWSENGNPSFLFYNKTNQEISIDLSECFFIVNGISYDYFQNRTYSYSSSSTISNSNGYSNTSTNSGIKSTSSSTIRPEIYNYQKVNSNSTSFSQSNSVSRINTETTANSRGYTITYNEQKIINIPSNSGKVISEFNIVPKRYINCDLLRIPESKNGIDSLVFSKDNSPYAFRNSITYKTENEEKITVVNNFFVNKIMNINNSKFFYYDYKIGCDGQKPLYKTKFVKYYSPKNFFIRYSID